MMIAMHGVSDTPFGSSFAMFNSVTTTSKQHINQDAVIDPVHISNVLCRCNAECIVMNVCDSLEVGELTIGNGARVISPNDSFISSHGTVVKRDQPVYHRRWSVGSRPLHVLCYASVMMDKLAQTASTAFLSSLQHEYGWSYQDAFESYKSAVCTITDSNSGFSKFKFEEGFNGDLVIKKRGDVQRLFQIEIQPKSL